MPRARRTQSFPHRCSRLSRGVLACAAAFGVVACSSDSEPEQQLDSLQQDVELQASDFGCIRDWDQVRGFRITNKAGNLEETLRRAAEPGSGDYPVGTLIQLVPTEAMVKRAPGFNAASNDWEFFLLEVSPESTSISARGVEDVVGPGGNCLSCHEKAEPRFDLVCERDHGCDAIPVTREFLLTLQDEDPRCAP